MKKTFFSSILTLLLAMLVVLPSCSDDTPAEVSEDDIVGIWQDKPGHILEMADSERMYEYTLTEFYGVQYWRKTKPMYFYEPRTELMLKELIPDLDAEDQNSQMHVYKIVEITPESMTMCWVAEQDVSNIDGENIVEIFKVFFDKNYVVDPAKYQTFRKLTPSQFKDALGDIEIPGD